MPEGKEDKSADKERIGAERNRILPAAPEKQNGGPESSRPQDRERVLEGAAEPENRYQCEEKKKGGIAAAFRAVHKYCITRR